MRLSGYNTPSPVHAEQPPIFKALRSRNPRTNKAEKLYVIRSLTFDGLDIYTKGKILKKEGVAIFYVLRSLMSLRAFLCESRSALRKPRGIC